jgi:hypothetical protein
MIYFVIKQSARTGEEGCSRETTSLLANMAICKGSRDCVRGHQQATTSCDRTGTSVETEQRGAEKYRLSSCASKKRRPSVAHGLPALAGVSDGNPTLAPMATDLAGLFPSPEQYRNGLHLNKLHSNNCHLLRKNPHYGVSLLFSSLFLDIAAYEHCDV